MATPMTASQIIAQLKKWDVKYQTPYAGWATHNRGTRGNGWGPVNGFIWHHTGADGDDRTVLYDGRSDLPGPLCHFAITPDGTVIMIGWGRANHAGLGDSGVLAKVVSEQYTGMLKPTKNDHDGNGQFYGVEIMYAGTHGMSHAQYLAALKLSAAVLDFHKWSHRSVIAHGEWTNTKWDPGYANGKIMDMNAVRNDVHATLFPAPVTVPPPPVKPTPPPVIKPPVSTAKNWDLSTLKVGDSVKMFGHTIKVES